MKIAIINDTHFGEKNDSEMFLNHQKKFFDNVFFPEIEKLGITKIFHLGDLVHRRKFINFHTSKRMREDFLDKIENLGYEFHIIAGNHDVYYRNTNEVNAFEELLSSYNFKIYTDIHEINLNGTNILLVPWIPTSKEHSCFDMIKKSKSQICFGHLELNGFSMSKHNISDHGHQSSLFENFDIVLSGHYHFKSSKNNIHYLGCPYQMSWSEQGTDVGFHIFDLSTRELQFIPNPYGLYHEFVYNDAKITTIESMESAIDLLDIEGTFFKIVVEEKTNPYMFDMFVDMVESKNPYDLKIIDSKDVVVTDEEILEDHDTQGIINSAIDSIEGNFDKKKLKSLMEELYKLSNTVG